MPSISTHREDSVDNLIRNKYPEKISQLLGQGQPSAADFRERQDAWDIYEAELINMDSQTVSALYQDEKEKARVAKLDELEYQDNQRFFHQPHADADLAHWSKAPFWTLEETIALSLGKEPSVINAESVALHLEDSLLAQRFANMADLVIRAVQCQQLDCE